MRNIFVINPTAGSKKNVETLRRNILNMAKELNIDLGIYMTKAERDAEAFIHTCCNENPKEIFRFFGCGGDGTLNEVMNASAFHDNAITGSVPIGTGNDFVRNFENMDAFFDLKKQLEGEPFAIDLIRCEYEENGIPYTRYCNNMINIGFDSNVVEKAGIIRKQGIVTGSMAYLMSVLVILIQKKGADLRIELDNGFVHDGPLLLFALANGSFCGGGFKSSPYSKLDDGIAEASLIRDVSRKSFINLLPSYKKGTHVNTLKTKDILDYYGVKSATIKTNGEIMRVSNDGEIVYTNEIKCEVVKKAVKFSVPKDANKQTILGAKK